MAEWPFKLLKERRNTSTVIPTKFYVCGDLIFFFLRVEKKGERSFSFVPDFLNGLCWEGS